MARTTGPELAARLRPLVPTTMQAQFDDQLSELAGEDGRNSVCGVLMVMGWIFNELVEARDGRAIELVLGEMESLLTTFPRRANVDARSDDSVWNGVLACFFELALPVAASEHAAVMAHLGPISRAAHEQDPWWLEPREISER